MEMFTKGPWTGKDKNGRYTLTDWDASNDDAETSEYVSIVDQDKNAVCLVVSTDWDGKYLEANAKLIAAAPDLYEALQAMLEFPNAGPSHDMARAALSKATA